MQNPKYSIIGSKIMSTNDESATPQENNELLITSKKSKFSWKIYPIIAVALIAVIAVALIPQPGVATIPLTVNYQVGERMVYDEQITVEMLDYNLPTVTPSQDQTPTSLTTTATLTTDVLDFDGESYTLNQTISMDLLGQDFSFSITQKISKSGFSTFILDTPSQTSITYNGGISQIKQLLDKPDVKVGESIQVPIEGLEGNLTLTFGGIETITVPAGDYKVYKVNISGENLTSISQTNGILGDLNIQVSMNMKGDSYVEYETGRQIKYTVQSTTATVMGEMKISMATDCNMELTQHIIQAK